MASSLSSLLSSLGVDLTAFSGGDLPVRSAIDGAPLASLRAHSGSEIGRMIAESAEAFEAWRVIPAPVRGEMVRRFGEALRAHKAELAELVTMEAGKTRGESLGEVQEMIDICDFAVGLSRTLGGLTLPSERPQHVMEERWEPLGPVGVISAFNFPVAVWAWNAALAWVCGDTVVWKPSEITPLCALACHAIFEKTAKASGAPDGLSRVILGGRATGEQFVRDTRLPLISATGSCRMGEAIGQAVSQTLGRRALLELGGNNPAVITPSADLTVAMPSIFFGAVGTAGQRCTTTRRLFVHESLLDGVFKTLQSGFAKLERVIGDPREAGMLIGPLIHQAAFETMQRALTQAKAEGGVVHGGGRALEKAFPDAYYVHPALVDMRSRGQTAIVLEETFAPILYVIPYRELGEAIGMINAAPQGLSSCIFTSDLREAERFKREIVAGIVNVNIGTSGAEIGGAFGGEKATGGGRESGSDSWKAYMRRITSTTYWGATPPKLAQGVEFSL